MSLESAVERLAAAIENLMKLQIAVPSTSTAPGEPVTTGGPAAKPGRKKVAETPVAEAPLPGLDDVAATNFLDDEAAAPPKKLEKSDVRAKLVEYQAKFGPKEAQTLLNKWALSLGVLKEEDYGKVIAACTEALAKAK